MKIMTDIHSIISKQTTTIDINIRWKHRRQKGKTLSKIEPEWVLVE